MIIMGVDPGIATVGYGVVSYEGNRFTTIEYGAILTPAKIPLPKRLETIYDGLCTLIKRYNVQVMSVEELFFNTNVKTAIQVGHGRGVILLAAQTCGIEAYEYTPLQVKQAVVGYGRAQKKQVQEMVRILLNLKEVPKPDDTADALAMAICHAHSYQSRQFR
jgi:crossover junction endodeoxyribonuclease RuvC